jgi:hypothetical protein
VNQQDAAHAWWSRLRHQGLLLSPVVMLERFPSAPDKAPFHVTVRLRNAYNRFASTATTRQDAPELEQPAILGWVDALLEHYVGHGGQRIARQHSIPEKLTAVVRIGSRSDTIRPHRVIFADQEGKTPALLVMADTSPQVGRGRGRTAYARFLELLRGTGHRLGLLTNGHQFRLVYAGLDFESWCEWECDRWFDDGEGTEELCGLRQLLSPASLQPVKEGVSGLLDAVEESRKRQADLSSVLRENVRQAVELLLEEVSAANRTNEDLFASLVAASSDRPLTDAEAHDALLQATVRVVMRLVVCLFAESRQLLPVNDPIYAQAYGVRSLYELLEEAVRNEGGTHGLLNRNMAWPRLMALFRLIHGGSAHGAFPLTAYGGALFRPGDDRSGEPVPRAMHILEHGISVCDAVIYHVLRKLLRGPLPVLRGRAKTFVEGPVDYTDLRTEFIGLIYEGLLDYRLKRTDEKIGPQVFLNLGREPVLPLARLEEMLRNDKKGLKNLLTTLRKEQVAASAAAEEEEAEEDAEGQQEENDEAAAEEIPVEAEVAPADEGLRGRDYLDAVDAAKRWAKDAVLLAGLVSKQGKRETDSEYQTRIEAEANRLINRVVAVGEFYLVRAGNTRKGTGTFYTRPQLAVPTVHRTLEPLCYEKAHGGKVIPKTPEAILGLKVCDPACGSASFLVAALHYLTDSLYQSLRFHKNLDDPAFATNLTLPFGLPRTGRDGEELVPFPPDDPRRGDTYEERVKALLRPHVVERCIYGVDINPLAVELARVSLWVETLDRELPFSFLDHKIKVGNSLVGCWRDRVREYPLCAWERNGGDDPDAKTKGPRSQRIEEFLKGPKQTNGRRTGDGLIKREMRAYIESLQPNLFSSLERQDEEAITHACSRYETLHSLPCYREEQLEQYYRDHFRFDPAVLTLRAAMDRWCAVWFWPTDPESLKHVPTPGNFQSSDSPSTAGVVRRLAAEVKFFHWELEFPDALTPERDGFDAMLGNPPWDVMKPNSQEFFTEYDPLYRTLDKQAALRRQRELFDAVPGCREAWDEYNGRFKAYSNWVAHAAHPFEVALARGAKEKELRARWAERRGPVVVHVDPAYPYRYQGSADLNSYKLFTEVGGHLLRKRGRMGLILPSGIYSDAGTKKMREMMLTRARWEWLFVFENRRKIFDIDGRFKFGPAIGTKSLPPETLNVAFMVHDLSDWDRPDPPTFPLDPAAVTLFSPRSKSLPEVRTRRDFDIARTIYSHSIRIGDEAPGWEISYATEFHMTNDSKHFPPLEKWKEKGYKPDVFGRWVGPKGEIALPLYEGRMIGQFDCSQKGWVSGKGRSAVWRELPFHGKTLEPQYLVSADTYRSWGEVKHRLKVGFMDVTSATNARTMIAVPVADLPCGNAVPVLYVTGKDWYSNTLFLAAAADSLTFDFATRQRAGGLHLNWFIVEECPIPNATPDSPACQRIALATARLTFLHRRFAPEWLRLKHLYPELASKEWKHWWAVTEADRIRLRVEIDALCASLYGLEPDDYDWIVRDDPTDPKSFYRVDRHLPFRERLTGLAAAAFRALKEGNWSAESAAKLSNEEFFALIGIPDMTTGPDPLIGKRDGCHRWKPEEFGPDDPRHGWTWDDCWKDAVALLGSEDAVRKYIEGDQDQPPEEPVKDRPTDLFGNAIPTDLFGNEIGSKKGRKKR